MWLSNVCKTCIRVRGSTEFYLPTVFGKSYAWKTVDIYHCFSQTCCITIMLSISYCWIGDLMMKRVRNKHISIPAADCAISNTRPDTHSYLNSDIIQVHFSKYVNDSYWAWQLVIWFHCYIYCRFNTLKYLCGMSELAEPRVHLR